MQEFYTNEVNNLLSQFKIVTNLSRKKLLYSLILSMLLSRKVHFCELAVHLNNKSAIKSNEVRIQNFFRLASLDYDQIALLLFFFLPSKGKINLCLDRTEWDFGKCQVNILLLTARCQNITVPLYWELLDNKSGNSNTDNRIELLNRFIVFCKLIQLSTNRLGVFYGDREFIGHRWLKYLKNNDIGFCVRIPKHHKITRQHCLGSETAEALLNDRKVVRLVNCRVDGVWANVYLKRLSDGTILFIFGTPKVDYLGQLYRKRWSIEALFQAIKLRGFDLESTHLKCFIKLKKLLGVVSIAYVVSTSVGRYTDQKIKKIAVKKHGYKAYSFTRKGIEDIRNLIRDKSQKNINKLSYLITLFSRLCSVNKYNINSN